MITHNKKSHKGENGRVLVIGGSEKYTGCLVLAGVSCLRTGVDIVTIAAPEKVAWAINSMSPDLVTIKLTGKKISLSHFDTIKKLSDNNDVLLIGNGIGLESVNIVKKIVKHIKKPLVIDADGIKSLSLHEINNAIITPHAKELEILLVNSDMKYVNEIKNVSMKIKEIQKYIGNNVILLKGQTDYIFDSKKVIKVNGGNERMTVAGTGDILAGLSAGYLAQTNDLLESAVLASKNNKKIGDFLYSKYKYAYIASDMLSLIHKK